MPTLIPPHPDSARADAGPPRPQPAGAGGRVHPVCAVGRAVDLMRALGDQGTPMRLSDLCRRTGMPKSTVHRLLGTLMDTGVVRRVDTLYSLAQSPIEGWPDSGEVRDVRRKFAPYVGDLYFITRQTVGLAILHEGEAVFLERISGKHGVWTSVDETRRIAAHRCAAGRLLMSYGPAAMRFTPGTAVDPGRLHAELARIRRDGFAFNHCDSAPGVCCLAVPMPALPGLPRAALSITGFAVEMDSALALRSLRMVAGTAARDLNVR
jgi:DNA-binding IclR family transcriptional regulator